MSKPQIVADFSHLELKGMAETFLEKRIAYSGNNPIYIGYNRTANASTSETSWFIVKITYSGSNPTYYQLPNAGTIFNYAWDSRTTYFP
jgi:hypothetical protein